MKRVTVTFTITDADGSNPETISDSYEFNDEDDLTTGEILDEMEPTFNNFNYTLRQRLGQDEDE